MAPVSGHCGAARAGGVPGRGHDAAIAALLHGLREVVVRRVAAAQVEVAAETAPSVIHDAEVRLTVGGTEICT